MNDEQLLRYSRHLLLEGFDVAGQQALLDSSVLLVGVGGLGSPAALYLASSGVGRLSLVDDDVVELSNLQRQVAFRQDDLGQSKARVAAAAIRRLNPDIEVEALQTRLQGEALQDAVRAADLVVDASDNFATRCALSQACLQHARPLVSGAAIRAEGQVVVFDHRHAGGPCYRCLYKEELQDQDLACAESGVLAPVVGVIGSMLALEALKLLAGYGASVSGRLSVLDARYLEWRQLQITPDPECPYCS